MKAFQRVLELLLEVSMKSGLEGRNNNTTSMRLCSTIAQSQ